MITGLIDHRIKEDKSWRLIGQAVHACRIRAPHKFTNCNPTTHGANAHSEQYHGIRAKLTSMAVPPNGGMWPLGTRLVKKLNT